MAISITVYPQYSPRLVEILSVTTASVQDIYDAIRAWEDLDGSPAHAYLIDGAGKDNLGGAVQVGITATLQNAQIFFTGRTTPLDTGVGRTCDATDSTGTELYVDDADFVTAGVYVGATVVNLTTREQAQVVKIVDLKNLKMTALGGVGSNGWTSGDNYMVLPHVECTITGGNLVAVDSAGDPMTAICPSPGCLTKTEASTSASVATPDPTVSDSDKQAIADQVWDEALRDHTESGSMGSIQWPGMRR